jgi:hypothetical protein
MIASKFKELCEHKVILQQTQIECSVPVAQELYYPVRHAFLAAPDMMGAAMGRIWTLWFPGKRRNTGWLVGKLDRIPLGSYSHRVLIR